MKLCIYAVFTLLVFQVTQKGSMTSNYRKKLDQILRERNAPLLQFIKYGFCGGLATVVDMLVFYMVALWLFPSLTPDDWLVRLFNLQVPVVDEVLQARNFVLSCSLSFIAANTVAYVTNILWVFDSTLGKRRREMFLFLFFSLLSVGIATTAGWVLIRYYSIQTSVSFVAKIVVSLAINFVARKYIIFRTGLVVGSQAG